MKTLSVFDSNEDITNFVQGKIRVSGMDIFYKKNTKIFDHFIEDERLHGRSFIVLLPPFRIVRSTHECQNQC